MDCDLKMVSTYIQRLFWYAVTYFPSSKGETEENQGSFRIFPPVNGSLPSNLTLSSYRHTEIQAYNIASQIKYLNASPVFVDSNMSSWNMCPEALRIALKSLAPKAVVVTDIYGQSADYNLIMEICDKHKIPVIEDAAESFGAEYNNKKC